MLDLMRKNAKSWLIKAALGGIIVTFIFWYGFAPAPERSPYEVAKVNGEVIPYDQFRTTYDYELKKIKLRFRQELPPGLLEKLDLKKRVVNELVDRTLLLQEANRLGLTVTTEDLREDIVTNPMFQRNGVFSKEIYEAFLRQMELSPPLYEQIRRRELLESQVIALLTDSVKTDPQKIRSLWDFQNDKLTLSVIIVPPQKSPDAKVDEAELEAYFADNREKYRLPANVDVEYVDFSWKDAKKKESVDEKDARNYFETHPEEFTDPEQVRASHILVKVPQDAPPEAIEEARKKAEELKTKIGGGADFAEVARTSSDDTATASKGGDLGFFSRDTLNKVLEDPAFDLDVGKVSDVIRAPDGFHIIKVVEKKPEKEYTFDEVKAKLMAKLLEERARKAVANMAEDFYEKVYRSENLQDTAKEFGFKVKTAKGTTKALGIPGLGSPPEIMDELFELKSGEISKLGKVGDDYVIVKVLQHTDARLPELDQVRPDVVADFKKDKAMAAAMKKAKKIIAEIEKDPKKYEAVAKEQGLSWQTLDPLTRVATLIPKLGTGPEVNEMLTSVSPEKPLYPQPLALADGVAIVRLANLAPADGEQFKKEEKQFTRWIVEVRKTEFLTGWIKEFKSKANIEINERIM